MMSYFSFPLKPSYIVALLTLQGCMIEHQDYRQTASGLTNSVPSPQQLTQGGNSPLMRQGIIYLKEGDLEKANAVFRAQLKMNPKHSMAHFFNGLTYKLMAKEGNAHYLDMANVGFSLAAKHDPTNFLAWHYKGLMELEAKDYPSAQNSFATAYMLNAKNPKPLYGLAVSSYYAHDVPTAVVAIQKAVDSDPRNTLYLRTGAIIMAAANQKNTAHAYAKNLSTLLPHDAPDVGYVANRITEWGDLYAQVGLTGGLTAEDQDPTIILSATSAKAGAIHTVTDTPTAATPKSGTSGTAPKTPASSSPKKESTSTNTSHKGKGSSDPSTGVGKGAGTGKAAGAGTGSTTGSTSSTTPSTGSSTTSTGTGSGTESGSSPTSSSASSLSAGSATSITPSSSPSSTSAGTSIPTLITPPSAAGSGTGSSTSAAASTTSGTSSSSGTAASTTSGTSSSSGTAASTTSGSSTSTSSDDDSDFGSSSSDSSFGSSSSSSDTSSSSGSSSGSSSADDSSFGSGGFGSSSSGSGSGFGSDSSGGGGFGSSSSSGNSKITTTELPIPPLAPKKPLKILDTPYVPPTIKDPYADAYQNDTVDLSGQNINQKILTAASQPKPLDAANQMVSVDVVIMVATENVAEGYGMNLLDGLQLTLGGNSTGTAGNLFNYGRSLTKTGGAWSQGLGYGFILQTANATAYNLNIANVAGDRSEIIARPTLTALTGTQATFTSGNDIVVAGEGDNSLAGPFKLGVNLVVTPTLLQDGRVSLAIQAQKSDVADSQNSGTGTPNTFTSSLFTNNSQIQTTVTMNLGDTLILGGLSERDDSTSSSSTPLLGDIPILQYFFHRRTKTQFRKSVIFLVTPRLPDYTYMEAMAGADASGNPISLQALLEMKNRFTDWFKPDPNLKEAFKHFSNVGVYREFRNGDALSESWENIDTLLKTAEQTNGMTTDF